MHLILVIIGLLMAAPAVWAAEGAAAGPNADSPPLQSGKNAAQTPAPPGTCPERPRTAEGAPSAMIVSLDPDTLWRPRGSEVRFTIGTSGGSTVTVTKVRVCFGWSNPNGEHETFNVLRGSPQVRSIGNDKGLIEYGALVPQLNAVPNSYWWPRRLISSVPYVFTGAFTVPVSDMVVEVTPASGDPVIVTSIQVGVTNVAVAWIVVIAVAALVWLILYIIARHYDLKGRNLILRIISSRDGYASLSQLQIILWTFVVGASAIYVMTLSGNLIAISAGTLTLLGIASTAGLLTRAQGAAAQNAPQPAGVKAEPTWADLVVPDRSTGEIDVTRLQMLAFTLIVAAFVLVKVVVDYEIPTIPESFLVLMGISNGVYVTGRGIPSPDKKSG
jgi:energy-converting hydrogenase Eha subunit E